MRVSEARKREHDESVALALMFEEEIQGVKSTTAIFALCWVLASLILGGEHDKDIEPQRAIRMIAQQIRNCVKILHNYPRSKGVH